MMNPWPVRYKLLTAQMIKDKMKLVGPSEDYAFITETPEFMSFLEGYVTLVSSVPPDMDANQVRMAYVVLQEALNGFHDAMDEVMSAPPSA